MSDEYRGCVLAKDLPRYDELASMIAPLMKRWDAMVNPALYRSLTESEKADHKKRFRALNAELDPLLEERDALIRNGLHTRDRRNGAR